MKFGHLPKVELHLHLDCSLSYAVVSQIDPSITIETYNSDFIAPAKCENLRDYLTRAPSSFPLMQTDEGLSPHEVVANVEAAFAEAVLSTGIDARIILCTLRFFSEAQSLETVKLVEGFRGTYVAAFDIAADKPGNVIDAHISAFQYAHDNDIPYTAHVGETRGIENVWDTLEHFSPTRFGHGVCSIEDPALLELLREQQIHLEACPTCNVQTDCYDTFADHPIDRLYRAGISIGVYTDTRTISNITLNEEYEKLHRTFGWEKEDFYRCNRNALKAGFIPEDVRIQLLEQLADGYQQAV